MVRVTLLIWFLLSGLIAKPVALACSRDQKPFRLGLILPLTGSRAYLGENALFAAQLARDNVRDQDPCLEFSVEDSQADGRKGVDAYQKLKLGDIQAVLTQHSSVSLPIAQLVNKDGLVQMALSTTAAGYSIANDLTFRVNGTVEQEAEAFVKALTDRTQRKAGTLAIFSMQDEYPLSLKDKIVEQLKRQEIPLALEEEFLPTEVDFRALVSKAKSARARYIFVLGYAIQGGQLVRQAKELGLDKITYFINNGMVTPEFITAAGSAADNTIAITLTFDSTHPAVSEFRARYGREPDWYAANGYDGVIVMHKAAKYCMPKYTSSCLKEALFKIHEYHGFGGLKGFDEAYGDMKDFYALKVVRAGRFEAL